jgi:hypothetical protein
MEIIFKTTVRGEEEFETQSIIVDNKTIMKVWEGMEPEDVRFCRDLPSPFDCKELIEMVIEAVKRGEKITFEYV